MSSPLSQNTYVPTFSRNGDRVVDPKACCRAKYVPDFEKCGMRLVSIARFDKPVFSTFTTSKRQKETRVLPEDELVGSTNEYNDGVADEERSIRRARNAVFDLCLCNNFDLFCTFTYDPKLIDSTSYADVYKPLKEWFSNRVQRHGLKYVAVPEYHKKGQKIHFHFLCNKSALERDLIDSGLRRVGKTNVPADKTKSTNIIYNVKTWKFGWSTAISVSGENAVDKTAKYIAKYMGKQKGKIGGRRYLSGGDLQRPTYVFADNVEELWDGHVVTYVRDYDLGFTRYTEFSYL